MENQSSPFKTSSELFTSSRRARLVTTRLTTPTIVIVVISTILSGFSSPSLCAVIHYDMDDEVENASFVGNLAADATLPLHNVTTGRFHGGHHTGFHFFFLSSPHEEFFHLDRDTGELYTNRRMDRDTLCKSIPECKLELNVQAKSDQFSTFIKVLVKLKDVNDNPPVFDRQSFHLNLSEAETVGKKIKIAKVSDDDSPDNGLKRFILKPEVEEFAVQYNNYSTTLNNEATYLEVFLVVKKPLDRETQGHYQLNLMAEDYGTPPLKAILPITITLLDVNDNVPAFDRDVYMAFIEENSRIGASVIQVRARDDDLGESGEVIYGFEKRFNPSKTVGGDGERGREHQHFEEAGSDDDWNIWEDQEVGGPLFRIEKNSGLIYVAGSLDRESIAQHVLSVSARDLQSDKSKSVVVVRVEVGDVNDNPPIIYSQSKAYNVSENCGPRTFVELLTVTDLDSPENTRLSCSTDSPTFALESIIGNQYQLVTSADPVLSRIDRETHDEYHILITCSDGGSFPSLTGTLSLEIHVIDRNDNHPRFELANYTSRILENYLPEGVLLEVHAFDDDEGLNGLVRYRLEAAKEMKYQRLDSNKRVNLPELSPTFMLNHLEMDELTGSIRVVKPFDREKIPVAKILAAAYDLGTPSLTSFVDIIIFIDDVDDEKPVFSKSNYTFAIQENQPSASHIGAVQAYDADEEPFNSFNYFMHRSDIFRIDQTTGSLSTLVSLDRELIDFYVFDVFACPTSGQDDCTFAHVTVRIADENDNSPRFIFPAPYLNYTLVITNSFQYGDRVTKIMAEDDDEPGTNSRLVYQALDTTYFRLNSTSGMVIATRTFAVAGEGTVCEFPVVVSDCGDPPRSAEAMIIFVFNSSVKSFFELERDVSDSNFYIVICIAITSAFLSAILVVAILFVARKQTLPQNCEADKKTDRIRTGSKKKKDNKSTGKSNNASSLKLRCQQPFPVKSGKIKNKGKKKKLNNSKDTSGGLNSHVNSVSFDFNNGCLKNNRPQPLLEDISTLNLKDCSLVAPQKQPQATHHQHHITTAYDGLTDEEDDPIFKQNMPDVVDKISTLQHLPTSKYRYHCNTTTTATLATKMSTRPPQLPLRTTGNLTLGYYNDHNNYLRPPASAEVKFKPEAVTKDNKYFTNSPTNATFALPPVCYPNNEQKINSYGSFV